MTGRRFLAVAAFLLATLLSASAVRAQRPGQRPSTRPTQPTQQHRPTSMSNDVPA